MMEQAVKFDLQLKQAHLCDVSQLDQILQEAESRQQRARHSSGDVTEVLTKIAGDLAAAKLDAQSIAREVGTIAISLAKLMTEQLVGNADALQADRLSKIIEEALSRPEPIKRIFVNPNNHQAIQAHFQSHDELKAVELSSDQQVAAGECRIEMDTNTFVSSMKNQLQEIESRLLELNDNV